MTLPTRDLVAAAQAGRPRLHRSDVRRSIRRAGSGQSVAVTSTFAGLEGAARAYQLRLPRLAGLAAGGAHPGHRVRAGQRLQHHLDHRRQRALASRPRATARGRRAGRRGGPRLRRGAHPARPPGLRPGGQRGRAHGRGRAGRAPRPAASAVPRSRTAPRPAPAGRRLRRPGVCWRCAGRRWPGWNGGPCAASTSAAPTSSWAWPCGARSTRFVEYDWFPASFTAIDQLIRPDAAPRPPAAAGGHPDLDPGAAAALGETLEPALAGGADHLGRIEEAVERGERRCPDHPFRFDAIGVCFPDVVVRDKIVGGEVYKTRGIRENPGLDYEREFRRLSDLDEELRAFVSPGRRGRHRQRRPDGRLHRGGGDRRRRPRRRRARRLRPHAGHRAGHGLGHRGGRHPRHSARDLQLHHRPGQLPRARVRPGRRPQRQQLQHPARRVRSRSTPARAASSGWRPSTCPRRTRRCSPSWSPGGSWPRTARPCACRPSRRTCASRCSSSSCVWPGEASRPWTGSSASSASSWPSPGWESELLLAPRARERILFGRLVKHRPCFASWSRARGGSHRRSRSASPTTRWPTRTSCAGAEKRPGTRSPSSPRRSAPSTMRTTGW